MIRNHQYPPKGTAMERTSAKLPSPARQQQQRLLAVAERNGCVTPQGPEDSRWGGAGSALHACKTNLAARRVLRASLQASLSPSLHVCMGLQL